MGLLEACIGSWTYGSSLVATNAAKAFMYQSDSPKLKEKESGAFCRLSIQDQSVVHLCCSSPTDGVRVKVAVRVTPANEARMSAVSVRRTL